MVEEDRVKKQRLMGEIEVDQPSMVSGIRPVKRTRLEQDANNSYNSYAGALPLSTLGFPISDRNSLRILRPGPEVFTVSPRPSCKDARDTLKFNREPANSGTLMNLPPSGNFPILTPNFQQHFIFMSPDYKAGRIIDPVAVSLEDKCLPSTVSTPRSQTQRIPFPKSNVPQVIEISDDDEDDDDDCVINEDETNRNLCWGMIETSALVTYQSRNGVQGEEEKVQLKRESATSKNKASIRVIKNGEWFGWVKQEMADILGPLIDENLIWTEASIRNPIREEMVSLKIIVYGPPGNTKIVSTHLYERGVLLSKPVAYNNDTRYLNPHNPSPGGSQLNKKNVLVSYRDYHRDSGTTTTKSSEETRSQIDKVFNSLMNAENIPEEQPDPRIITPLYKHQKQALYFLLEREKFNDFTNDETNALTSLWRTRTSAGRFTVYYNVVTNDETEEKPIQTRGGIVADDMGLGKTIQIIALVLGTQREAIEFSRESGKHSPRESRGTVDDRGPVQSESVPIKSRGTLIVCPLSTVSNWEDQLTNHVQQGSLSFYVYHGGARISDPSLLIDYDIVITTYNVSGTEFSRALKNKIPSALQRIHWFRVVLDEAHIIKDVTTIQSKAACSLVAERRWCLTGTPIQNKADDLFALIKFLHMVPFNIKENWTSYILRPIRSFDPIGISRLQTLMKCITLRRTKMLNGKSLLSLPPRNDHIRYLELNEYERKLYNKTFLAQVERFKHLEKNNIMQHYVNFLQSLLRLRQICAHFALIKESNDLEEESVVNGLTLSKAMTILNLVKESGMDQCGSCMQELTQKSVVTKCEHLFCIECATRIMGDILNSENEAAADSRDLQITIACPSCGTGLGSTDIIEASDSKNYENHLSRAKAEKKFT